MNKKKGIIIGVLALLVTMVVGYALFGKNIEILGTATASGNFELSYNCEESASPGATTTCNIVDDKITTTSTFSKPTDETGYRIKITNTGTIPAVLKTVDSSNNYAAADINVNGDEIYLDKGTYLAAFHTYWRFPAGDRYLSSGSPVSDKDVENANLILEPGQYTEVDIRLGWFDTDDLGIKQPELKDGSATIEYNVTLGFQQITN